MFFSSDDIDAKTALPQPASDVDYNHSKILEIGKNFSDIRDQNSQKSLVSPVTTRGIASICLWKNNICFSNNTKERREDFIYPIEKILRSLEDVYDIRTRNDGKYNKSHRFLHDFILRYIQTTNIGEQETISNCIKESLKLEFSRPNPWKHYQEKDKFIPDFFNLPISQIFHLNDFSLIPPPVPFTCEHYPLCNFTTNNINILEYHRQHVHNMIPPYKINFLIHELIIIKLLDHRTGIINKAIEEFSKINNLNNYQFLPRICPFPDCSCIIFNDTELINHIANFHKNEVVIRSLNSIGLFWTLIYAWTKYQNKLPTIRNLLKDQVPTDILEKMRPKFQYSYRFIFKYEHFKTLDNKEIPTPLWILIIDQQNFYTPIPDFYQNKGLILPPDVCKIEDSTLFIQDNIINLLTQKSRIIAKIPNNIKIKNYNPCDKSLNPQMAKDIDIPNLVVNYEPFKIDIPKINKEIIPISIPDIKFQHEVLLIPIQTPKYIKEDFSVPIQIPEYIKTNYPIDIPDFKLSVQNVSIPIPEYSRTNYPINIPYFNVNNVPVNLPNIITNYTDKSINVPKFEINTVEQSLDIPIPTIHTEPVIQTVKIPIPKYEFETQEIKIPLQRPIDSNTEAYKDKPQNIVIKVNINNKRKRGKKKKKNTFIHTNLESSNNNNQARTSSSITQTHNETNNNNPEPNNTNTIVNATNPTITNNPEPNNPNNPDPNNNLNEYTPEMLINDIKTASNKEGILGVIAKWKHLNLNRDLFIGNQNRLDIPITNIIAIENKWPGVGRFDCPVGDEAAFTNVHHLKEHEKRVHGRTFPGCTMTSFIESISLKKIYWEQLTPHNDHVRYFSNDNFYPCYCPGCNYFSNNQASLASHLSQKHPNLSKRKAEIGWIWATVKEWIDKNNNSPSINQLVTIRVGYLCGICNNVLTSSTANLILHASSKHSEARTNNIVPRSVMILKTTVTETLQDEDIKRIEEEIKTYKPPNNNNNNDTTNNNANTTQGNTIQQNQNNPVENQQTQQDQEIVNNSNTQPIQTETNNNRTKLLEKCRKWLSKAESQESNKINLPKLTRNYRIKISKPIDSVLKDKIIPLLKECTPINESETEWIIFEGGLAKMNLIIRKTIRKALHIPIDKMTGKYHKKRFNEEDINKFRTVSNKINSTTKIISNIEKIIQLKDKNSNSVRNFNIITKLEEQIIKLLSDIDEDFITKVFGGKDIANIRNLINDEEEHRSSRLAYIQATLNNQIKDITTCKLKNMGKIIQNSYYEDPCRTLRWYILNDPSPECKLDMKTIEEYYHQDLSDNSSTFTKPKVNSDWDLGETIDNADRTIILNSLIDKEQITNIIKTRSNVAACGPDGIGNAIWKTNVQLSAKIIKLIIKQILKFKKFPLTLRNSKSILLYKKGDPKEIKSWRPISISTTLYRIIMCHITKVLQGFNSECNFINPVQKGFKAGLNGISEHISTINELIAESKRSNKSIVITTLDFTNAFGSIPHKAILWAMKRRGFPIELIKAIKNLYQNSFTNFHVNGEISDSIQIKRGVRQGCPLSPTLFNLCLESLLKKIQIKHKDDGFNVPLDNGEILNFTVQAYADDVILISHSPEAMQRMLNTVEKFCQRNGMKIAPQKCKTLSYIKEGNKRISIDYNLKIQNEDIPNQPLLEAIQYLGAPISTHKDSKKRHSKLRLNKIQNEISKIIDSPLKINQKLDAIRRMILPELDFEFLNGSCPEKDIKSLDLFIRCSFMKLINTNSLPVDFFYLKCSDGGLGLPCLWERMKTLQIRTFIGLNSSKDQQIRELIKQGITNEIIFRKIEIDDNSPFLDIPINENNSILQIRESMTNSILANTMNSLVKLKLGLKRKENNQFEIKDLLNNNTEDNSCIVDQNHFLKFVNKLLSDRHGKSLRELPLKGHTFNTLINNPLSNFFVSNYKSPTADSIIKFAILSRTNNIPTGEILHKNNKSDGLCKLCHNNAMDSLMHRLNGCISIRNKLTKRHNAIADEVIKGIKDPKNIIFNKSRPININNTTLHGNSKLLQPDIWFLSNNNKTLNIIEVTVPYGQISNGKSTLDSRREEKLNKYQELINDCKNTFNLKVNYFVVVVSSLGAVPKETLNDLYKLYNNKKTAQLVAKRCCIAALRESMFLIYDNNSTRNSNNNHNSNDEQSSDDDIQILGTTNQEETHNSSNEPNEEEDSPELEDVPFEAVMESSDSEGGLGTFQNDTPQ